MSDAVASILSKEPDWDTLPSETPPAIRRLLRRCLAKNPAARLHEIADARLEIDEASSTETSTPEPVASDSRRAPLWIVAAAALGTAAVTAAAFMVSSALRSSPAQEVRTYRSEIVIPGGLQWDPSGRMALSPDGRRLAFLSEGPGRRRMLWVRSLDSVTAQALNGTTDAMYPFWSADSQQLAFIADGKLKRIDAAGGTPVTLADAGGAVGAWALDGTILFLPRTASSSLYRIPAAGGTQIEVTRLEGEETRHLHPMFLPDGRRFLYVTVRGTSRVGLYAASLDAPGGTRLLEEGSNTAFARDALLYVSNATLLARPFDPSRLAFSRDPVPIAENLLTTPLGSAAFTVSANGTLVFQTGTLGRPLNWVDRAGRVQEMVSEPGYYTDQRISPDGKRLLASVAPAGTGSRDIWMIDLERASRTRPTFDPADDLAPVWAPDGRSMVFASNRKGAFDLYRRTLGGSEPEELLLADGNAKTPYDITREGASILFGSAAPASPSNLWALPTAPGSQPAPFLVDPFNKTNARLFPDGRWVAYQSTESGRQEVYVASFPSPGRKWQVSTNSGSLPVWGADGREIFYRAPQPSDLVSVRLSFARNDIQITPPQRLFDMPAGARVRYDVSADGQRFLLNVSDDENLTPLTLVLNPLAALRK